MTQAKPLKYPNATRERVRVSSKSNISKCIEEIQGKFAEQNKDNPCLIKKKNHRKFVKSCFGTLYKQMKNIVFSGGIVHNIIIRQVESMNENVMEFNFNGKGAIFTKKEFGIITGLKMCTSFDAFPPPHSFRLLDTYFDGCRKIKNSEFREKFIRLTIDDLKRRDDLVKLCLLYFLECGLLGKESQSTIDIEHFSMVEDLNYFNQYAWGLESYKATIASLHKVLKLHNGQLNASNTYSLCGFPIAFQVWGYETIPLMGEMFANKVRNSFPRICNWEATNIHKFKRIGYSIFEVNELQIIGKLRPMNSDEQSYYGDDDIPILSQKKQRVDDMKREYAYFNTNYGQPSHSSHDHGQPLYWSHDFELKGHARSIDMKIDRISNAINMKIDRVSNGINMKIDRLADDLNKFKSDFMREIKSVHDTLHLIHDFMRKGYQQANHDTHSSKGETYPANHDTHMHNAEHIVKNAKDDMAMGGDIV